MRASVGLYSSSHAPMAVPAAATTRPSPHARKSKQAQTNQRTRMYPTARAVLNGRGCRDRTRAQIAHAEPYSPRKGGGTGPPGAASFRSARANAPAQALATCFE